MKERFALSVNILLLCKYTSVLRLRDVMSLPPKRSRLTRPSANLWESVCGRMLRDPDIKEPTALVVNYFGDDLGFHMI